MMTSAKDKPILLPFRLSSQPKGNHTLDVCLPLCPLLASLWDRPASDESRPVNWMYWRSFFTSDLMSICDSRPLIAIEHATLCYEIRILATVATYISSACFHTRPSDPRCERSHQSLDTQGAMGLENTSLKFNDQFVRKTPCAMLMQICKPPQLLYE